MTPNGNIAQVYQGTQINTASPAELTLMLYEGAIKFLFAFAILLSSTA